jgi:nascent polypeptide-associated complex subunit alpha
MQMEQAKKFAQAQPTAKPEEASADAKDDDDDGEPLSEDGLTPDHIKMVMEHGGCSRNKAIKVLRECNDDTVQAVMKLNA